MNPFDRKPSSELLGYFQMSLRDTGALPGGRSRTFADSSLGCRKERPGCFRDLRTKLLHLGAGLDAKPAILKHNNLQLRQPLGPLLLQLLLGVDRTLGIRERHGP